MDDKQFHELKDQFNVLMGNMLDEVVKNMTSMTPNKIVEDLRQLERDALRQECLAHGVEAALEAFMMRISFIILYAAEQRMVRGGN